MEIKHIKKETVFIKIIDQAKSIVYDIEKLSLYDGDHETDPED